MTAETVFGGFFGLGEKKGCAGHAGRVQPPGAGKVPGEPEPRTPEPAMSNTVKIANMIRPIRGIAVATIAASTPALTPAQRDARHARIARIAAAAMARAARLA